MMPRNDVECVDHEVRKLAFPARACVQHRCTCKPNEFKAAAKGSNIFFLSRSNIFTQHFALGTNVSSANNACVRKNSQSETRHVVIFSSNTPKVLCGLTFPMFGQTLLALLAKEWFV